MKTNETFEDEVEGLHSSAHAYIHSFIQLTLISPEPSVKLLKVQKE